MKSIRVGMIGAGWMGKSHAAAFQNAALIFGNQMPRIVIAKVADTTIDAARALARANDCGIWTDDWRDVVLDPSIDVIDISTPNDTHFPIAQAAIAAGKHIYCEKPLTLSFRESALLADQARAAGVVTLVGFNYLQNPAQQLARDIIGSGEIGDIVHFRGVRDGEQGVDPLAPFTWRHDRKIAGSGALGDTGTHALAMAQMLVGDVDSVFGHSKTFVMERPVSRGGSGYFSKADVGQMRAVENDDTTACMLSFANGAVGSMSCSRVATGRRAWLAYEIQGTNGALCFTQQRMNELRLYRRAEPLRERGYRTIHVGPAHGVYSYFHNKAGFGLGYNDLKVIEAYEIMSAIRDRRPAFPDFSFAAIISQVVDAILLSAEQERWVDLKELVKSSK